MKKIKTKKVFSYVHSAPKLAKKINRFYLVYMDTSYSSKTIAHLGLISGISKELCLVETIDSILPSPCSSKIVSYGESVLAMILNGLGFVNHSLYLTPKFFEDKPVDVLIGSHIEASHLNDDCLGRCLDVIYDYGCSKFYSLVVSQVVSRLGLDCKNGSMDMTNLSLYGDYLVQNEDAVQLTQGYSKDHRPDLKQVSMLLITSHQNRIPILMKVSDYNGLR